MTFDLPSILAFTGVLLTVLVNLVLGVVKSRSEKLQSDVDDEGAFQERLLKRLDTQEERIDKQGVRIEELEKQVDELRQENRKILDEKYSLERRVRELELEKKKLEAVIAELEAELHKLKGMKRHANTD